MSESKIDLFVSALRGKILNGDYGKEGYLPDIKDLATHYSLSRTSISQGIGILKAEGLVVGERSFRVNRVTRVMTSNRLGPFGKTLESMGLTPSIKNVGPPCIATIPDNIASLCGLPLGLEAVCRSRVMGTPDTAYQFAEFWYVTKEARQFLQEMQDNPDMNILIRVGEMIGLTEQNLHEVVTSRFPTSEEMGHLGISNITPVLESLIVNSMPDGQVLLIQKIVSVGSTVSRAYDYTLPNV